MPIGNFNPYQTVPTMSGPSVSTSGLAGLQANQQQYIQDAIAGLKGYGQAGRTQDVQKALLDAKTAEEIQKARGAGSLLPEGEEEYAKRLRDAQIQEDLNQQEDFSKKQQQDRFKHSDELAKTNQEYAVENLNTSKQNKKDIIDYSNKNRPKSYSAVGDYIYERNTGELIKVPESKGSGARGLRTDKYKPTGSLRDAYNEQGAEAKEVIKFFDTPQYNLQFKPTTYKDNKGVVRTEKGSGTYFFDGRPVTLKELEYIKQDLLRDRARSK